MRFSSLRDGQEKNKIEKDLGNQIGRNNRMVKSDFSVVGFSGGIRWILRDSLWRSTVGTE